jgi:L-serine dehydratase
MRKDYISMFDVIGPVMVGPSSSHTSGAATIAWMSRQIFTGEIKKVDFTLYGSFADTYKGHGTDRALLGGILGFRSDDTRIKDAYELAKEAGVEASFTPDHETEVRHPNTVDIRMEAENGHTLMIRAESIGGGRVRIVKMNDIDVDFTGEYSTVIVGHKDKPGAAAYITGILSDYNVNIAFLRIFRKEKGGDAVTVIESDDYIPERSINDLMAHNWITSVDLIEV